MAKKTNQSTYIMLYGPYILPCIRLCIITVGTPANQQGIETTVVGMFSIRNYFCRLVIAGFKP